LATRFSSWPNNGVPEQLQKFQAEIKPEGFDSTCIENSWKELGAIPETFFATFASSRFVLPYNAGMIVSETLLNKHRVVLMDPPILRTGTPVLVGLHGLGTNADDFMDLASMLDLPECRFILPDAPLHLPGYPPGAYAWYDFENHDREGIEKSRDHLIKIFNRFTDDPNVRRLDSASKTASPLVVFGFSQGGVMALEAGLNYPGKLAALVSMSGYMPDPSKTLADPKLSKDTPILLIHGTYDDVVPIQGSREAVKELEKAGYKPELREFDYAHQISEVSLETVACFIGRSLKT